MNCEMYPNVEHKKKVKSAIIRSHELIEDGIEVVGHLFDLGLLNHQVFLHLLREFEKNVDLMR